MQFIYMGLATLFVIVLACTGVLLFGSRTSEGGGLQTHLIIFRCQVKHVSKRSSIRGV